MGPKPVLGDEIEARLVKWVVAQHSVNNCVPKQKLIEIARKAAVFLGLPAQSVGGYDWQQRFWNRNRELSIRQAQFADTSRSTAVTRDKLTRFFQNLELALVDVKPENIWITDETGFAPRNTDTTVSSDCCIQFYCIYENYPLSSQIVIFCV